MLLIDGRKRPQAGICLDIMNDLNCDVNCIFNPLAPEFPFKF